MQYEANAARWGREKMNFPEGIPKMPLIAVQHEKLIAVSMEKVMEKLGCEQITVGAGRGIGFIDHQQEYSGRKDRQCHKNTRGFAFGGN